MADIKREDNPFEDEKIAQEWINSVENEEGKIRDKELYPALKRWIENLQPKVVVDIGSGQGICSEKIQPTEAQYIGIEPSEALTKRARKLYQTHKREFITGNAYALPVDNNIADAAFSVNVWFHLADLDTASLEMARILKPGGSFLIITANPAADHLWESFFTDYSKNGKIIDGTVQIPINPLSRNIIFQHTLEEITGALQKAGLNVEKIETFGKKEKLFINIQGTKP